MRRLFPVVLLLALALLTPSYAAPAVAAGLPRAAWRAEVLRLVNVQRTGHGLRPVRLGTCLQDRAAQPLAARLSRLGRLQHQDLYAVMRRCPTLHSTGENIAMGQRSPAEVMRDWMRSPGHRANILRPGYTRLGVGVSRSASGTSYWVEDFGR